MVISGSNCIKLNMNNYGGKKNFQRDCCAGNESQFRRTSSLRLRGEKCFQQSPHTGRRYFPSITEHNPSRSSNVSETSDHPRLASHPIKLIPPRSHYKMNESHMNSKLNISDAANTPPGSPEDLPDDDSLRSYGSCATAASCDANYAAFNGTTFSGRSMRYVLHCSSHAGLEGEDYLTPTQRAQRQIRKLKALLTQAKKDIEKKDSEIFNLTKEVVELRLFKASLCSPDDKSNSSEIITIKENPDDGDSCEVKHDSDENRESFDVTDSPLYKQTPTRSRNSDMQSSFTDSGHFEDLTITSLHSKDSVPQTSEVACMTESASYEEERRQLIDLYEKKIEDLMRSHFCETQELKKSHNEKVEALLQKLSDANTRYSEFLPNYEQAHEKIHSLEKKLEEVQKKLAEEENKQHSMYLEMYNKGIEAAKLDSKKEEPEAGPSNRVSVAELLEELQVTQTELENIKAMYRRIVEAQKGTKGTVDPEVTLQFLKSAIYYFLTDPVNHQGHLNAIEKILGFTEKEKQQIRKARST